MRAYLCRLTLNFGLNHSLSSFSLRSSPSSAVGFLAVLILTAEDGEERREEEEEEEEIIEERIV